MIQRIRRGRARKRRGLGHKVAEALPSGTVRDHRVEGLAGVPRADQRLPQLGECLERLADRGRLVPELRFAGTGGFAIRSADDPVVGLHHRVGEEHLPLDGADRENRDAAVVRELAEPVGEVALPLPAQPPDPVRRDLVEEAFRNIETPDVLEAVQQPVGVGGIVARLELPEPDEPCHAGVGRLFEQMLEVAPKPGRARPPVRRRRAARSLSWPGRMVRVRRQDLDEPARQVLVRLRLFRFFSYRRAGGNVPMGVGLRPRGRKRRKRHRRPTGHAPPLDSTRIWSVPFVRQATSLAGSRGRPGNGASRGARRVPADRRHRGRRVRVRPRPPLERGCLDAVIAGSSSSMTDGVAASGPDRRLGRTPRPPQRAAAAEGSGEVGSEVCGTPTAGNCGAISTASMSGSRITATPPAETLPERGSNPSPKPHYRTETVARTSIRTDHAP